MANSTFKEMMSSLSQKSNILHPLSEAELQNLKKCLLEMFQDVYAVCQKYDLTIMLGGGSALGAIRHQGFIPWDDDLDLLMPRSDYEAFASIFEKELSDKYILVAPNYAGKAKTRFPKIMKKGTVMKELTDINSDLPCGIFLDIFPLENVPENKLHRKIKGLWCNVLMLCASRAFWYEHRCPEIKEYMCQTDSGKKTYAIQTLLGFLFHIIPSWKWFNAVDQAVQHKNETPLVGIPSGSRHYFGEIFPRSVYLPTSYAQFENMQAPIPGKCSAYLNNLYGDYMQIPPPEKRAQHLVVELDLNPANTFHGGVL